MKYLPLLPDEHLVSGLMRSFVMSGYTDFLELVGSLNVNKHHSFNPHDVYGTAALKIAQNYSEQFNHSINYVLKRHTLLPIYNIGNPISIQHNLITKINEKENVLRKLWINRQDVSYLQGWKFCPRCIEEDIKHFGVSYWHCSHQLPTISSCLKHNTRLRTADKSDQSHREEHNLRFPQLIDLANTEEVVQVSTSWEKWLSVLFQALITNNNFNVIRAKSIISTHFDLKKKVLLPEETQQLHLKFDPSLPLPKLPHYQVKQVPIKDSDKYLKILERYLGFEMLSKVYSFYTPTGRVDSGKFKNFIREPMQNIEQKIEHPMSYLLILYAIKLSAEHLEIDYGQFKSDSAA
jgi:hypothetical protein